MADPDIDHFSDANKNLIKFHGTYQQEDRDARKNRTKAGVGKHYMFMVRLQDSLRKGVCGSVPIAVDEILRGGMPTARCASLRARHPASRLLSKGDLQATIKEINDTLLTTLGACGDVERNVMSCPRHSTQCGKSCSETPR